jgi:hypothetical protein
MGEGGSYRGECDEHARFMVRALKQIGSTGTAYLTYASTDPNVESPQSKPQDGKTWFLKFDFDNDGYTDNNFEGSVEAAGHYYAVTPSLDGDSKCGLLRAIGTWGATQRWVRMYNDDFDSYPIEHLPGTEDYPTCP